MEIVKNKNENNQLTACWSLKRLVRQKVEIGRQLSEIVGHFVKHFGDTC